MPNVNRPQGLMPLEYLDGSPYNGKCRQFFIASTDPNAYAIGDPVVMSGDGDANGVAGITLATAADSSPVLGAIIGAPGIVYGGPGAIPGALDTILVPATKTRGFYVLVSDDPDIVYSVQEGGAGAALTSASIGLGANLLAGTNTGFVSGWQFNNASTAATAVKQIQLLGLVQTRDNTFGQFASWKARISFHQYNAPQVGV